MEFLANDHPERTEKIDREKSRKENREKRKIDDGKIFVIGKSCRQNRAI